MAEEQKHTTPPPADSPPTTSTPASTVGSTTNSRPGTPTLNGSSIADKNVAPDGKAQDDTSKLRTFLSILKKFIGVTDIAAVRFSLPAQLMEPVPNLEYWNYLDRPESFAAMGDSDDEVGRMLEVLRFWFTKDLKYVKGKPCKPYNSTLGEFFRCTWNVEDPAQFADDDDSKPKAQEVLKAAKAGEKLKYPLKVSYLTEQTSHHPPVSAFVYDCPEKGINARGYDQLSAKFTGTSVRVVPGQFNKGIFVTLSKRDNEEYQLTHPAAYLGGFIRGNLNVTVSDTCYVTCPKTGIKVLLHYAEEGYFGKTQNKVEGVIYRPDNLEADKASKISDVSEKNVLGRLEGCWKDKVYYAAGSSPSWKKVSDKDKIMLIDLNPLVQAQKQAPPLDQQLLNESRRFWNDVTEAILARQYSTATAKKQELEEAQRQKANQRQEKEKKWQPRFFTTVTESNGKPEVSEAGTAAVKGLHSGDYHLEEPQEYGAF